MQDPILRARFFLFILFAGAASGCSSLLYYPTRSYHIDPKKYFDLEPQDVFLDTSEGYKLHAWYFTTSAPKPKGSILFFHGNGENLSSHYAFLVWVVRRDYNLLVFDYPGYGRSTGKPSPKNTVEGGRLFMQWMEKNTPQPWIVYGHSLGGAVALRCVAEEKDSIPLKALVIEGSFNSYQRVAQQKLSNSWLTWPFQLLPHIFLSDSHALLDLKDLPQIPLLFIHGNRDPVVDYKNSKRMFQEASEPKQFWIIEGGGHGNTYVIEKGRYQQDLLDYLELGSVRK